MVGAEESCPQALTNLYQRALAGVKFPQNVFHDAWSEFYFFDSDWMFNPEFVEHIQALMAVEGAVCACLANLDSFADDARREGSTFFIDSSTTPDDYRSVLVGASIGTGWIHDVERFGCTSEICEWSIYCERRNEIAVIAIRRGIALDRYYPLTKRLRAAPIKEALRAPLAYGFSGEVLSVAWSNELLAAYASRT